MYGHRCEYIDTGVYVWTYDSRGVDIVQFLLETESLIVQPDGHLSHHHGCTDPILVQYCSTTHEPCSGQNRGSLPDRTNNRGVTTGQNK